MIKNYVYDIDKDELIKENDGFIDLSKYAKPTFYDQIEFHEYHQKFADEVFLLNVKSNDKILGYCYLGLKDNKMRSPYSSPFALIHLRDGFKIKEACLFVECIKKFAYIKEIEKIYFTLPPDIYNYELVSTLSSSLFSGGFKVKSIEMNNYFDLTKYIDVETYLKKSPRKVKKNYNKALKNELIFEEIEIENIDLAYDVIRANREEMGYPLKISLEHMLDLVNMRCLNARSYVIKKNDKMIASAIIFDVTEKISQVVYWGDIPEYRNERAMDLLTLKILEEYKKLGKKYLDIGPSSEDGIINVGLADFKKSIGCNTSAKLIFEYDGI